MITILIIRCSANNIASTWSIFRRVDYTPKNWSGWCNLITTCSILFRSGCSNVVLPTLNNPCYQHCLRLLEQCCLRLMSQQGVNSVVGTTKINLISMMFYDVNNLQQYCFNRRKQRCFNMPQQGWYNRFFSQVFPHFFPGGDLLIY